MDAADMGTDLQQVLISREEIESRLDDMAEKIDADYAGKDLLLVGVLKGAVYVMADLSRRLRRSAPMDWMAVSSYGSGTKSSGVVRILKDLDTDLTGRHVLIVEDIVDTGLTLSYLQDLLRARRPASLRTCVLLDKSARRETAVKVDYCGFDIPDAFVVGYGLDYAGRWRHLKDIRSVEAL